MLWSIVDFVGWLGRGSPTQSNTNERVTVPHGSALYVCPASQEPRTFIMKRKSGKCPKCIRRNGGDESTVPETDLFDGLCNPCYQQRERWLNSVDDHDVELLKVLIKAIRRLGIPDDVTKQVGLLLAPYLSASLRKTVGLLFGFKEKD
jgi:hypothetical protein